VSEDETTPIERDLNDAIAGVLARHERSMLGNWVALIETVQESGDRGLWTLSSPDVKAWDTVGMLTYGLQVQQAQIVAAELAGDDLP
jgi:hypothetical protein